MPGLEQWENDAAKLCILGEQRLHVAFELAACAGRDNQAKGLHQPPDLVRQFRADPHEAGQVPRRAHYPGDVIAGATAGIIAEKLSDFVISRITLGRDRLE